MVGLEGPSLLFLLVLLCGVSGFLAAGVWHFLHIQPTSVFNKITSMHIQTLFHGYQGINLLTIFG